MGSVLPDVIILGIAAWLRTRELNTVSLWFDESCCWRISTFPLAEMFDAVARDAHPPGYYLILKGWTGLWGDSPVALRSLSVLAGVASVAAAIWLARLVARQCLTTAATELPMPATIRSVGWLAGLLVALAPLQIEMSLEARPYTLATCATLVSAGLLLLAWERERSLGYWMGLAAATLLLSGLHYYAGFTVLAWWSAAGAAWLVRWRREGWTAHARGEGLGVLAGGWLLQIAWIWWFPTFAFQRDRANAQLWMPPLTVDQITDTLWRVLAGGKTSVVWPSWTATAALVWGLASTALLLRPCCGLRLLGWGALLPPAAAIAYGVVVRNILGVRYLIIAHVVLLVGMAVLAMSLKSVMARRIFGAGLLVWTSYWTTQWLETRYRLATYPGIRSAVGRVAERRRPGDVVLVGSPFLFTTVRAYLRPGEGVYTRWRGDHTDNILSGPPLRREDYAEVNAILARHPPRLWLLDGIGLLGNYRTMPVPTGYRVIAEKRFAERFGHRCDVLVRELEFIGSASE